MRSATWGREQRYMNVTPAAEGAAEDIHGVQSRWTAGAAFAFTNDHLRMLVDDLPTLVAFWDVDLICRFANREYERWFGVDHLKLVGTTMEALVGPALFARNSPMISAVLSGARQDFERLMVGADGISRNALVTYLPATADGVTIGFIVHIVEVNRLKAAEERLREEVAQHSAALDRLGEATEQLRASENAFRQTLKLNGQIPWTVSSNGSAAINPFWAHDWEATTGTTSVGSIGELIAAFIHEDDQDLARQNMVNAVAAPAATVHRYRIRLPDGGYRWMRFLAAPNFDADGAVVDWLGTVEDIQEQVLGEQRLQRLETEIAELGRVAAMNSMASTLAHELTQPLAATANYINGARRMLANGNMETLAQIDDALAAAEASTMRSAAIIRNVRAMVAKGSAQCGFHDTEVLIANACVLALSDASGKGIRYRTIIGPGCKQVFVDRVQLEQVLVNLLRNAVEALETAVVREIEIVAQADRDIIEISVTDTGTGVDSDVEKNLFEAFNSTKIDGLGVGLSICRTIMEGNGGRLAYAKTPSGGARFAARVRATP